MAGRASLLAAVVLTSALVGRSATHRDELVHADDLDAVVEADDMRALLATEFQANSTLVNDTITLAWPSAAFADWCSGTPTCSTLPSINYTLSTDTFNSSAWGWQALAAAVAATPALTTDLTVVNVRGVADVAEVGLQPGTGIKNDTSVCSSSQPCEAQLAFKLKWSVTPSDTLLCVRLEPSSSGGYLVVGYPAGTGGLRQVGAAVAGVATCATTHLGAHTVLQYTRVVFSPPPSPPTPPPPPPMARETGKPELAAGPVSMTFRFTYSLDFGQLKASDAAVAHFSQDTKRYISQGLAAALPGVFANASNTLPYYDRLTLVSISPGSVLAVYRVVFPDGVTDEQVDKAVALVTTSAASPSLLGGSEYQPMFIAGQVVSIDGRPKSSLALWLILVIVACSALAVLSVGLAIAWYIRQRLKSSVLPTTADEQAIAAARQAKKDKKKAGQKKYRDRSPPPASQAIPLAPPNTAARADPCPHEAPKQGGSPGGKQDVTALPTVHQPPWGPGGGTGGGWFIMVPVPGPGMLPVQAPPVGVAPLLAAAPVPAAHNAALPETASQ